MTVSAANSDSYTESNISYVTCYTCACDFNEYGVTSNKKQEAMFPFGYKTLFFKVTMCTVQPL